MHVETPLHHRNIRTQRATRCALSRTLRPGARHFRRDEGDGHVPRRRRAI